MLVFWGTDWVQALKLSAFYLWGNTYSLLSAEQLKKLCRADAAGIDSIPDIRRDNTAAGHADG